MIGEPLLILLCFIITFLFGYVVGWVYGQRALMPIIADYKRAIASYREQIKNWYAIAKDSEEIL